MTADETHDPFNDVFDDVNKAAEEQPDDAQALEQALEAARAENAELKDKVLRGLADLENLRRRAEREKAEATLYAATNFARDLLPVADNFSRALEAISPEQREGAEPSIRSLLSGIEVTERELLQVFERYGIRRLQPEGEKFDPNLHQAMFEVPTNEHPPGFVVQVVQTGYAIGERCLRPALVGVAKAP